MAQVTLPYTLTPGTPENVSNLMSNLTALRDGVNTIDTAQIANGAVTAVKLASGVGGMSLIDSQTFTSSTTYTISSTAKILVLEFFGAGGGGGGGARWSSSYDFVGGCGGAGGGHAVYAVSTGQISGSVTVTVGAGGTAGTASTTNNAMGGAGGSGGESRFGSLYFPGGCGGSSTSWSNGYLKQGAPSVGHELGGLLGLSTGGTTNVFGFGTGGWRGDFDGSTSKAGYKSYLGGGGGGQGGGCSYGTLTSALAGGSSETVFTSAVTYDEGGHKITVGTGGGGAAGTSGGNGTAGTNKAGGGGGDSRNAATAGTGGAGATPSGGGGGGGTGKSANGGPGGAGGRAEINLWVYG